METQNVTLSLPKVLLRRAKHVAVERGTSLSRLLAEYMERAIRDDERCSAARERMSRRLACGLERGTNGEPPGPREALHER